MINITPTCGRYVCEAELFDAPTNKMLVQEFSLIGSANVWGEEIYFPVSISAELEEDSQEEVEAGTLAYWPPGKGFCIFFGPTPVSDSSKPIAYSPVNILVKIKGDLDNLKQITQDEKIIIDIT